MEANDGCPGGCSLAMETIADTARVMSRYVDLIMIRTFEEATL